MDETTTILESELLGYYFSRAGCNPSEIALLLGPDVCDALRDAIATELFERAQNGNPNLVTSEIVSLSVGAKFHSILYRQGGYSDSRKIITFGFKGMFKESALYLLGLVIAASTGVFGLASAPAAAGVVKAAWSKLEILREPEDREAIDLLEALSAASARSRARNGERYPTWARLLEDVPFTPERALAALKVLKNRSIIEISEWGDQSDDLENLLNRWKVSL